MTSLRVTKRWIAWLALALLACVPVRAAVGDAWLWSLGDPVCEEESRESCEELDHGSTHHCHCLETGFPESGSRGMQGSLVVGPQLDRLDPPAILGSLASHWSESPAEIPLSGPPRGSPFASRVGLTLHD